MLRKLLSIGCVLALVGFAANPQLGGQGVADENNKQVATEVAALIQTKTLEKEALQELLAGEEKKKEAYEAKKQRNKNRVKQHKEFLKSIGLEERASIDTPRIEMQERAVDARIATAERAIKAYQDRIGELDQAISEAGALPVRPTRLPGSCKPMDCWGGGGDSGFSAGSFPSFRA
jgi:coenzyme F420-reducing hydrogenase delta subunit